MTKSPKTEEIEQKMREEKEMDNKNLKNQIQALLKCDICNSNFDLNIHIPMVVKCGHSYCKKCIYNGGNKSSYGICPIDNIHHVLGIESCIPNLKLELIIKKIFNYTEPKITEKKIICFNHEIKLNSNSSEKDGDKFFRSNSGNKKYFTNTEEIFPKILTDKKNKTITNFKINKDKPNNLKLYNNDNVDVIEELNVISDDKIKFDGENKINDDSIETIPLNDDKSNANISFKDEFNELLNKNSDYLKKNSVKIIEESNCEEKIESNKNNKDRDKGKESNTNINNANINNSNNEHDKENEDMNRIKNKQKNNNNEDIRIKFHKNKIIYLSDIYRNSINFMKKNKKSEIDEIAEIDELSVRPRTITVSKNINIDQKNIEKNKDIKYRNKCSDTNINNNINNEKTTIRKINIYDKILLKKRKTISQENNDRNRNIKIKINIKNKSEEKEINIKEISKVQNNKKIDKTNKENNDNENGNTSDIDVDEKKKQSKQKYKILSKKIGLKRNSDYTFIHSNSNSNLYSPTNINNSSEGRSMSNLEKIKICKPQTKNSSSLNNCYRANKLFMINSNSNEGNKENKINFVSNDISPFEKKKYIDNTIKNIDYASNSYHKTKSTYNKKKLKGKSNLFLTVKNNYNISLNNSNNNITSNNNNNTNNNNAIQFMTHNNINGIHNKLSNNNINRVKCNKISLSMSPDNKDFLGNNNYNLSPICSQLTDNKNNYYKNNIHSTRDANGLKNHLTAGSKDINKIIKTITIKRVNSFATKNNLNNNNLKNEEVTNFNSNDNDDIDEIKNKLRYEFNKIFNYQIDLYENLKDSKNKQILLSRNKKYKSILEEFLNEKNSYDELKNIEICFLPEGELFIGQKELNLPIYGITYNLNGDYYKGGFNNGKKEGKGIMIYKNGTRYEGDFKNNKHEGFGKLKQLDGETFIGDWKDGKINGNGVRSHCNGDRYVGSYVNNIRNGHGVYTFSNGDSYEGNWINGKATGKGVFKFKNGDVYEGEFKDNIIMGQGNFKTKNGDVYLGIFKNGLINGKGILKYQNGEKYVGFFLNGKKNGIGKIYDINGKVYKCGYWKKDKYIGNKYI